VTNDTCISTLGYGAQTINETQNNAQDCNPPCNDDIPDIINFFVDQFHVFATAGRDYQYFFPWINSTQIIDLQASVGLHYRGSIPRVHLVVLDRTCLEAFFFTISFLVVLN
jgi:hypothetical protein